MEKFEKPKTISELLEFCNEKGMPLRQMRFFIGEDYPEARAFGIFQDSDGDFVVYKNKDDGTRAVRYKGPDEAFAVNELYEKLKAETEQRRNANGSTGYSSKGVSRSGGSAAKNNTGLGLWGWLIILITLVGIGSCVYSEVTNPKRGYYRNNDTYYYYDSDDWYYYDSVWIMIDDDDLGFNDDYDEYFISDDYDGDYPVGDFRDSDYYDGYYENDDDDWDDYDWGGKDDNDWGGWDAGDTNWNTDW